ncbi:DUF2267 domain-containing protein [Benzoatithermus flavus]|uniref:DUF2267 domain-containing protein n=1 Tax=Benzoatithermus flavus TaxID=3108223 RepID=A0ABU8Y1P5_9PROT
MSSTGLDVFDKTLQTTHIWLGEIMAEMGPDRQRAYHALRAVLHALRDRLPIDDSAHLAAQLPLLVRGIYYDGWHPRPGTSRERKQEAFVAHIQDGLQGIRPFDPKQAAQVVFKVIARHVSPGEWQKVKHALPQEIQVLWPEDQSTAAVGDGAGAAARS